MALLAAVGCGDGVVAPGPGSDGAVVAARFEHLADSVDGAGYSPTADALRHAAEIVRLTGHATPVTLTIDGATRSFHAVAEQLDFPNLECTWPSDSGVVVPGDSGVVVPGDSGDAEPPSGGVAEPVPGHCEVVGTFSMRTLIAWEPDDMAEVVRIVADLGSNGFGAGVPDVMTGLPTTGAGGEPGEAPPAPGDSAGGGGGGGGGGSTGYPGFMGEYLMRDVGSWWAVEGSQANELKGLAGSCTADRASFDWAEFSCEAARFGFEFDMRVEPVRYEPLTGREPAGDPVPAGGGPEGTHALAMGASDIDGVRLTVVAWTPPPLPPLPPPDGPLPPEPVDSTGLLR